MPLIALPQGRNLSNEDINEYMKSLSINISVPTIRAALFFKHPAYLNEQEYRFLQIRSIDASKDDVKTRTRGYSTICYIEFDWRSVASEALTEIAIGPAAPIGEARSFVEDSCRRFLVKPENVRVRISDIPYRAV